MADQNRFGEIISKCWFDADFKKRFVAEPKKVLKEFGIDLPDSLNVKVVENTDDTMYLAIPPPPGKKGGELSDAQLDDVSGGAGTISVQQTPTITNASYLKLRTIQLATSKGLHTCSTGQECVPH